LHEHHATVKAIAAFYGLGMNHRVTMSTLGTRGRFGNQIFQYAFLKIYARLNALEVETPAWIGRRLFGCDDPGISHLLPMVVERFPQEFAPLLKGKSDLVDVDFVGYFHFHTQHYQPYQAYFRSLFQPIPALQPRLQDLYRQIRGPLRGSLRDRGQTLVGLHLRRGDFGRKNLYIAPTAWYLQWLQEIWQTLDQPILFIASDDPESVLADFAAYDPVTTQDVDLGIEEADFYADFYLLTQCDAVAISNSTFSFAACLLNQKATMFARPHRGSARLVPFNPWHSEPLLDAVGEIYLIVFPDWTQRSERIIADLQAMLRVVATHPQSEYMVLLIDSSQTTAEVANLALSSAAFALLMDDIEIGEDLDISVLGDLDFRQWQYLKALLLARLVIDCENEAAIAARGLTQLPAYSLETFAQIQGTRSPAGLWQLNG
jgi:hypothetical protein